MITIPPKIFDVQFTGGIYKISCIVRDIMCCYRATETQLQSEEVHFIMTLASEVHQLWSSVRMFTVFWNVAFLAPTPPGQTFTLRELESNAGIDLYDFIAVHNNKTDPLCNCFLMIVHYLLGNYSFEFFSDSVVTLYQK